MSHELYRHFDADGVLLYVGISKNALARHSAHSNKSWHGEIASMTVERHSSRRQLEAAERVAIFWEKPKYNIAHAAKNKKRSTKSNGITDFDPLIPFEAVIAHFGSQAQLAREIKVSTAGVSLWRELEYMPTLQAYRLIQMYPEVFSKYLPARGKPEAA